MKEEYCLSDSWKEVKRVKRLGRNRAEENAEET